MYVAMMYGLEVALEFWQLYQKWNRWGKDRVAEHGELLHLGYRTSRFITCGFDIFHSKYFKTTKAMHSEN